MSQHSKVPPVTEGRRERKRRETRTLIADAAMALFQRKEFSSVTVDEIAEAADVSKRTFFGYFPVKEDVVLAWQDKFTEPLADAIAAGPKEETPIQAVERAMLDTLAQTASPESFEIAALIRRTPALAAREYRKYVQLEGRLYEALHARYPRENPLGLKLLAMIVIGALRLSADEWHATEGWKAADILPFTRKMFRVLRKQIGKLQ